MAGDARFMSAQCSNNCDPSTIFRLTQGGGSFKPPGGAGKGRLAVASRTISV